jgi:hypothetical protein
MAQVRVLGNLCYEDPLHSWALEVGESLARYEMLHNNFINDTMPGIDADRHATARLLNQELNLHGFRYRVPEIEAGSEPPISDVMKRIFWEMRLKGSSAHVAFALIGTADYYMGLHGSSKDPHHNNKIRAMACNSIRDIPYYCEGSRINVEGTQHLVMNPPFGPLPLKDKLKRASEPLTILFVSADPTDATTDAGRIRLLQEYNTLKKIVGQTKFPEVFEIKDLPSCGIEDLTRGLVKYRPSIFHFSGHGATEGLCVEGEDGRAKLVDPKRLANALHLASKDRLKGVILNACYAESQASYIADAVGHVIAMKGNVSDKAANAFTREVYQALGTGKSFDEAFKSAFVGTGIDPETSDLEARLIKARRT